jgi:predicted O-methyltransferase YrrM
MSNFENKLSWLVISLFHFLVAVVRVLWLCLRSPRTLRDLLFSFYSTLNEFHQVTHGRLVDFKATRLWRDMEAGKVFAEVNYINMDATVMRPVEVQMLASLTRHLKPRAVFEIGTYSGFTALHFAHNTEAGAKIYTLDLPADYIPASGPGKLSYDDKLVLELSQRNIHNRIFRGTPQEGKIVELFGDSRTFDYTPYAGRMDLVFIDGNHSYEYVRADTENAFRMLSEHGVIIWHDFDYIIHRDIFKYLNELSRERRICAIRSTRYAIFGKDL